MDTVLAPGAEPCRPGDLWAIGNSRLLCGDATRAADVARLTADQPVDLLFTSPPYLNQRQYGRPVDDWTGLMVGVFQQLPAHPATQAFVNVGLVHNQGEWSAYWEEWLVRVGALGWRRFGWYVWHQGEGMTGDWHGRLAPCFEFIFHLNRQARPVNKTVPCSCAGQLQHGRKLQQPDGTAAPKSHAGRAVQPFKIPGAVVSVMREKRPGLPTRHPAVFPVGLPRRFIEAYTNRGERVYDPLVGGGTTILAAEATGRQALGIEVEPGYCDIALARGQAAGFPVRRLERS